MSFATDAPAWRRRLAQWDMSHNAIPLALFAYTAVLQNLSILDTPLYVPAAVWYVFYAFSLAALLVTVLLTLARIIIHPKALLHDFSHPRLVHFFFLPAIIGTMALLTVPPALTNRRALTAGFYLLATYQTSLALYLFGEWLFATTPTNHIYPLVFMQTIAFFLLSTLASSLRLIDQATASLSVGLLLWLLCFVTNFQHVSVTLSRKHERPAPTFFLFIAPPAQASLAVLFLVAAAATPESETVNFTTAAEFPPLANALLYIDLFIYALMFRLFPTWWRSKFAVTWWAYVFPLSAATCTVLWRYQTSRSMFYFVLALIMFTIASVAVVVVASLTVWAIWTGRLPRNQGCEEQYRLHWALKTQQPSDESVDSFDKGHNVVDDQAETSDDQV